MKRQTSSFRPPPIANHDNAVAQNKGASNLRPLALQLILFFFFQAEDGIRDSSWSSDVCSSDLVTSADGAVRTIMPGIRNSWRRHILRSEERRVGKECRSRWSQYHDKKKENE